MQLKASVSWQLRAQQPLRGVVLGILPGGSCCCRQCVGHKGPFPALHSLTDNEVSCHSVYSIRLPHLSICDKALRLLFLTNLTTNNGLAVLRNACEQRLYCIADHISNSSHTRFLT